MGKEFVELAEMMVYLEQLLKDRPSLIPLLKQNYTRTQLDRLTLAISAAGYSIKENNKRQMVFVKN